MCIYFVDNDKGCVLQILTCFYSLSLAVSQRAESTDFFKGLFEKKPDKLALGATQVYLGLGCSGYVFGSKLTFLGQSLVQIFLGSRIWNCFFGFQIWRKVKRLGETYTLQTIAKIK